MITTMWTKEEVEAAWAYYYAAFIEKRPEEPDDDDPQDVGNMEKDLTSAFWQGDMGTQEVAQYDHLTLLDRLGIPKDARIPNMRTFEKRAAAKPEHWGSAADPGKVEEQDYANWKAKVPKDYQVTPHWMLPDPVPNRPPFPQEIEAFKTPISVSLLRPHPHQVQALAALIRNMFTSTLHDPNIPTSPYVGPPHVTLHADGMGLGKTYQTIMTIAYLIWLRDLQDGNKQLPVWISKSAPRPSASRRPSSLFLRGDALLLWLRKDPRNAFHHRRAPFSRSPVERGNQTLPCSSSSRGIHLQPEEE